MRLNKIAREGDIKELFYADDLMLLEDIWKKVEIRYARWKKAMTEKGLKVDVKKTKVFFCTGERTVAMKTLKIPCSVCGRGVGRNSIMCLKCTCWAHKRCSGIPRQCILSAKNVLVLRLVLMLKRSDTRR